MFCPADHDGVAKSRAGRIITPGPVGARNGIVVLDEMD